MHLAMSMMSACYDFGGHIAALLYLSFMLEEGHRGLADCIRGYHPHSGPTCEAVACHGGFRGLDGDSRANLERQSLWRAAKVTAGKKQHILNQRGYAWKDPGNEGKVASQENQEPDRINPGQKQSKIIKRNKAIH